MVNGTSTALGTYACDNGYNTIQTDSTCGAVSQPHIAPTDRYCDMLFYRSYDPAVCLQMEACDSAGLNCLSNMGNAYHCNGKVQVQPNTLTPYVCDCQHALYNTPANTMLFPQGNPSSSGCGLPTEPWVTSTSSSLSVASTAFSISIPIIPPIGATQSPAARTSTPAAIPAQPTVTPSYASPEGPVGATTSPEQPLDVTTASNDSAATSAEASTPDSTPVVVTVVGMSASPTISLPSILSTLSPSPAASTSTAAPLQPITSSITSAVVAPTPSTTVSSTPRLTSTVPGLSILPFGANPNSAATLAASQASVAWAAAERASALEQAAAAMPKMTSLAVIAGSAASEALYQASLASAYAVSASSLAHVFGSNAQLATFAGFNTDAVSAGVSEASSAHQLAAGAASTAAMAFVLAQQLASQANAEATSGVAQSPSDSSSNSGSSLNVGALVGGLIGGLVALGLLLLLGLCLWRRRRRTQQDATGERIEGYAYGEERAAEPPSDQTTPDEPMSERRSMDLGAVMSGSGRRPSAISQDAPRIPPVARLAPLQTRNIRDEDPFASGGSDGSTPRAFAFSAGPRPAPPTSIAENYASIETPSRAYHPTYGGFDPNEDPIPAPRYSLATRPSGSFMSSRDSYASSLFDGPPSPPVSPGLELSNTLEARLAAYEARPTLGSPRRVRPPSISSDPFAD